MGEKSTTTFCKLPTPGMCVYMYIVFVGGCKHVFVCMCVHVFVYVCVYVHVCTCVCTYVYMYVCISVCVCVCVHMKLTLMANFTCRYFRDQSATKLNICKCPISQLKTLESASGKATVLSSNRHIISCLLYCLFCVC